MALGGRILGAVVLVGAGALTIAALSAAPHVLKTARPLLREGLKRGLKLYEAARASAAELAEDVEDLLAEVKADLTAKGDAAPVSEQSTGAP
ncbi:MAG: DUF5132 domain-containing protein [Hyphomonadaceae bacterium]|nr:DUF5132 domain-containing protein [Hyphomonadaceae bacterium]